MNEEKTVSYTSTNTYETLNTFTAKTKHIWLVFHGLGHLTHYFIEHFKTLPAEEHFVIAPQAPSKYYQDKKYKYVGASWLTRVNREVEMQNNLAYIDAVYKAEIASKLSTRHNFIVMGFSQGVSIATRWLAKRKIYCTSLILHSGKIPHEFQKTDFMHLADTNVYLVYGDKDPLITKELLQSEKEYAASVFLRAPQIKTFAGKHEVDSKTLVAFAQDF